MSSVRRAGAPRLIEWTGERCVPWAPDVQVVYEHFHRYLWAARVVRGRAVLDLGSGEGFGAAILSESAERVVGVDVDGRTVEHSRLNYAAPNLEFHVGTALDLSAYEAGSFGAVVAFEIIEHVQDQQRVLAEIARVLTDDGVLVISTPDRRLYSEASGQRNPFHERELSLDEFVELLTEHFPHVTTRGQRTITGSHMSTPGGVSKESEVQESSDFYIERSGEDWRIAGDPAALYLVALASKVELPGLPRTSTLADCELALLRLKERDAVVAGSERDAAVRDAEELARRRAELSDALEREAARLERDVHNLDARRVHDLAQLERDVAQRQDEIVELRREVASREDGIALAEAGIASVQAELAAARQINRRTEESVTWQAFQRLSGRIYATIGDASLLARTLRLSLRVAGRGLVKRHSSASPPSEEQDAHDLGQADDAVPDVITMPEYEDPKVSLIIPVYAHAELTRACLQSILDNTTHAGYEVILVDDAADPSTKRLLDGVRGAKIIRNHENLGYLRSMNRGAGAARGRWLVLLNNDTEVTRGWLRAMIACAESSDDVGVVTPKYLYPDGSLNEAGGIIWRDGTGANYGRGDSPDLFQYEYRRETDYGSAAALMVSADLWRAAGGFDERYVPMYYEDVDLCFEARERGFRVLYEPEAVVVHVEGASAGKDLDSGHKRYQELNRPKFVAKWSERLEREHARPASTNVRVSADRHQGPNVLIIDHYIPMWDRDAGSLRMLAVMEALIGLNAHVTFMPDNLAPVEPYTRILQEMGIEVMYGALDVNAELATIGPKLALVILSRPHQASRWLDVVREFAPSATVAYDTVDLHWLREARKSALSASPQSDTAASNGHMDYDAISPKAKALRELELAMMRATDVTLVVSDTEGAQIEKDLGATSIVVVPTVHGVERHVVPPSDRSGILFVGGFQHPPNVDAAVRLVRGVMPLVWSELGDVAVTVVGSEPPPEVRALASPSVDVAGWVEDLRPLLDKARLMVVPLAYGAGLKGKITQSLAVGLPVVTTPVGAEGFEAAADCMLIALGSRELAEHVISVYRDDQLWHRLSRAGQALVSAQCSPEVVSGRLGGLLARATSPRQPETTAGRPEGRE